MPKNIDQWFTDQFPLKESLLQLFQAVKNDIFGVNPYPGKVIEGKYGWLFADEDIDRGFSEQLGYERLKDEKIEDFADYLFGLETWCHKHNCSFIFMPIQEKASYYHKYVSHKKTSQPHLSLSFKAQ